MTADGRVEASEAAGGLSRIVLTPCVSRSRNSAYERRRSTFFNSRTSSCIPRRFSIGGMIVAPAPLKLSQIAHIDSPMHTEPMSVGAMDA